MARDRKRHARDKVEPAAPFVAAMPPNDSIAPPHSQPDHRAQLIAMIRALAREAARADHETTLPKDLAPRPICK